MLRILTASAVALLLTACGGVDDQLVVTQPATETANVGGLPGTLEELPFVPYEVTPMPVFTAEFDVENGMLEIRINEMPPREERFFFKQDVNAVPPKLDPPPCPACMK